jgi:hypothetical protein
MGERRASPRYRLAAFGLLASVLAVPAAEATIYRCSGKGKTVVFSDKPCAADRQQTRIGKGDLAGCFEIEDVPEWEGGSGEWIVRIAADGESYQLREYFAVGTPEERRAESTPLRRATLEEIDTVAQQYSLKVTGGYVIDAADANTTGVFNTWNHDGEMQVVGLFPFANGVARRVTCP